MTDRSRLPFSDRAMLAFRRGESCVQLRPGEFSPYDQQIKMTMADPVGCAMIEKDSPPSMGLLDADVATFNIERYGTIAYAVFSHLDAKTRLPFRERVMMAFRSGETVIRMYPGDFPRGLRSVATTLQLTDSPRARFDAMYGDIDIATFDVRWWRGTAGVVPVAVFSHLNDRG